MRSCEEKERYGLFHYLFNLFGIRASEVIREVKGEGGCRLLLIRFKTNIELNIFLYFTFFSLLGVPLLLLKMHLAATELRFEQIIVSSIHFERILLSSTRRGGRLFDTILCCGISFFRSMADSVTHNAV